MNTSQTILNTIKEQNIQPKTRAYFLARHAILWIPGVVVTLIGAFAIAGILFACAHVGFEYREFVYPSTKDFILDAIPYVWIMSYALFGFLIVSALRSTHTGYKLSVSTILLGSFTASALLGGLIYMLDSTFRVDGVVRYPVHLREEKNWSVPEEGRLSGRIQSKGETSFVIVDTKEEEWVVDFSGFGTTTPPFIALGESVRIVGTVTGDHVFLACSFFPWGIGGFPEPKNAKQMQMNIQKGTDRVTPPPQSKSPDCMMILESLKNRVREKRGM